MRIDRLPAARAATSALFLALLAGGAGAQDAPRASLTPTAPIAGSHGLQLDEHGLRGGGDRYRVRFDPGAVEFTPALGRAAERTMPVTLALRSIERGGRAVVDVDTAARPTHDGLRATYRHGAGVEERYDVAPEGVHQSFWFPAPLAGSGDLVVRLEVETELAALPARRVGEGPRFELADVGAVTVGGVTGIDARGREVTGDVRLVGSTLELALPAAFVDAAAYPLLLDPLLGTDFTISTGTWQDGAPDVAYDGDNAEYLIVWSRVFSLVDTELRGQRVQNTGALLGGTIFLTGGSNVVNLNPAVGSVDLRDRYLVAWQELVAGAGTPIQIKALAVDADTGFFSPAITVSSSVENQTDVAVGGDRGLVDDEALVVWDESNVGIRARQVNLPATGAPGLIGGTVTIAPDTLLTTYSEPAISKSGGDAGVYLITYTFRNLLTGRTMIGAEAFDRNLGSRSIPSTISSFAAVTNDSASAVDGDGEWWVVAYQREEFVGSSDHDVYVSAVRIGALGAVLSDEGEIALETAPGDDQTDPAVAYTGKHTLVGYDEEGLFFDTYVLQSVDPFTGLPSGEYMNANSILGDSRNGGMASQYSGGGSLVTNEAFDDVLVAFEYQANGLSDFDINAVRYDSGSEPGDLGGGCGGGGELFTPCTFAGNDDFRVRLEDAPGNRLTLLSISGGQTAITCGPCTLVTLFDGSNSTLMATTDASGLAQFPAPIPPGVSGAKVYLQAVTLLPGGPCTLFPQVRLSDGVVVTID